MFRISFPYFQDINFERQSPHLLLNCMCFAISGLADIGKNLLLTWCGRGTFSGAKVNFREGFARFGRRSGRIEKNGFGAFAQDLVQQE